MKRFLALLFTAIAIAPAQAATKTPADIGGSVVLEYQANGVGAITGPMVENTFLDITQSFIPLLYATPSCLWQSNGISTPATCVTSIPFPLSITTPTFPTILDKYLKTDPTGLVVGVSTIPSSVTTFAFVGSGAKAWTVYDALLAGDTLAQGFTGYDPNGATDSRAAIQNALNANVGNEVYIGPGTFRLDDMVTLNSGQKVRCAGVTKTIFQIDSATFNMNALGVFRLPTSDTSQMVDCAVSFVQPNTGGMTRNDVVRYPPAFVATVQATFPVFNRIRVNAAWECFHLVGNTGGADIGEIECGALADYSYADFTADATTPGVLNVTAVASGTIRTGMNGYYKVGITLAPYRIVSQLTGAAGGIGTYQLGDATVTFASTNNYQTVAGFVVDGPAHFWKMTKLDCWPYGITTLANLFAVYAADGTTCAAFGSIDGLDITTLSALVSNVKITPRAAATGIPYFISTIQFDGDGAWLEAYASRLIIGKMYSTKSTNFNHPVVRARNAGDVTIMNIVNPVDGLPVCGFEALDAGVLTIRGGSITHPDANSAGACANGAGASLSVYNTFAGYQSNNRTVAFFAAAANTVMQIVNSSGPYVTGVTGDAFSFATDFVNNRVVGSCFPGRTHTLSFGTSLGYYDFCEPDTGTTATPAFVTPGDSVLTVNSGSTTYWRKGERVIAHIAIDFSTNAYTTASGAFLLTNMGLPTRVAGSDFNCNWNKFAKVTTTAIQFWPFINTGANPLITINGAASAGAEAQLSTAGFPASTSNIVLDTTCNYLVK